MDKWHTGTPKKGSYMRIQDPSTVKLSRVQQDTIDSETFFDHLHDFIQVTEEIQFEGLESQMRSNWIVPKVLNFDSERNSVKKGKKILGATRTNFEFSEGKLEAGKNNYDFRSATKLQSCEPSPQSPQTVLVDEIGYDHNNYLTPKKRWLPSLELIKAAKKQSQFLI